MKKVTIVDYGMGNVFSVASAFEHAGAQVQLSYDPEVIAKADRLILPGVGAFADGMHELSNRNLIPAIHKFVTSDKPMLGICLGMQMLFDSTEEFGIHDGLGIISGKVCKIPEQKIDGSRRKIPHIGWNKISPSKSAEPLLTAIDHEFYCYFVHSFSAIPQSPEILVADCDYDGYKIAALVRKNMVWGCQFHPEKSSDFGIEIIKNFLKI